MPDRPSERVVEPGPGRERRSRSGGRSPATGDGGTVLSPGLRGIIRLLADLAAEETVAAERAARASRKE